MAIIPDGYSVIPGTGQAVAAAVVKAAEETDGVSQHDVTFSPLTGGFIVPDEVAKKYKAPKDDDGRDVNVPASQLSVAPPAESTGYLTSYAAGEEDSKKVDTEEPIVPKPNDKKAAVHATKG